MLLDQPLAVITPTLDADVLAVLARAEAEFTPSQVHALVGDHSLSGVRKTLNRLTGQGIVLTERRGNAITYRFNRRHLAARMIIELVALDDAFLARLRELIADFHHHPAYAAVFGSAARGEMRVDSDIDVFLVRPDDLSDEQRGVWDADVLELSRAGEECTGNTIEVLEMSASQVAAGLADGRQVLVDIQAEGLRLCGTNDYWRVARGKNG